MPRTNPELAARPGPVGVRAIGTRTVKEVENMDFEQKARDIEQRMHILVHRWRYPRRFWCDGKWTRERIPEMEAAKSTITWDKLDRVLCALDERERKVIELRFGLDGERPRTFAKIGSQLDVSTERIRQIEFKALMTLRQTLLEEARRDGPSRR